MRAHLGDYEKLDAKLNTTSGIAKIQTRDIAE